MKFNLFTLNFAEYCVYSNKCCVVVRFPAPHKPPETLLNIKE